MAIKERPTVVALLRPEETSWHAFLEHETADGTKEGRYNGYVDEWLDHYREEIEGVADELGLPAKVKEHQLHSPVPGTKTKGHILEDTDILTTIDPPDELKNFIGSSLCRNPMLRGVLAFSSADDLDAMLHRIASLMHDVFIAHIKTVRQQLIYTIERDIERRRIPRMFAFLYRDQEMMRYAVRQALLFPHGDTVKLYQPDVSIPPS